MLKTAPAKIKFRRVLNPAAAFILPSIAGCAVFIFLPSIFSFVLSFFKWNLISKIKFIGFDNYIDLFQSELFGFVFKNTAVYALSVTFFGVIIPLILAAALHNKIKGAEFFKTAYFMPFITPMTVTAMVWQMIFDPEAGLVNSLFKIHQEWLYDTGAVMNVLIFVSVWKLTGYNMIIFLSSFAALNGSIYEAAKIDGADAVKTFMKITLPLISPSVFFVMLITIISSFQVFDLIYLMTQGGPDNASNVLVYWLYKNAFEFFDIGRASAIAYVLFIVILVFAVIQREMRKKFMMQKND